MKKTKSKNKTKKPKNYCLQACTMKIVKRKFSKQRGNNKRIKLRILGRKKSLG